MGYKSHAQRKAVHAHKADGGKGHPDKKKGSPAKMENDSIAASNAWKEFKKSYMDRTHKMKGTKYEKPLSAEDNLNEYDREKNEFYYDTKAGKIKLIPTNDAEEQDKTGIEKWQLAPSMESPMKSRGGRNDHDMGNEYWKAHKKTSHGIKHHGGPSMKEDKKPQPKPTPKQPPMSDSEKRRMHATQSITDKSIKEQDYQGQVGIDLGTIKKKSALNLLGIGRGKKIAKEIMQNSPLKKISGPCKAAAKKKFKVWPSAYASGWGVRCTKAGGPSNYGGGKKK